MRNGDSFPQTKAAGDFLLGWLAVLKPRNLTFLTLRPDYGCVNETAHGCEQAVIPVADRKLVVKK